MRRRRVLLIVGVVLILGVVLGLFYIDRAMVGVPRFYAWQKLSGQFHGGQRANINGVSIYYETYGQGPPVLALHAGLAALEAMHYYVSALAPTHTVIAVDSRAHGRSTDSDTPLSYALMADDMIKLLDALHIQRVDIVGWSDGGNIGLDMAMNHPERVRRLIAVGANYDVSGLVDPPNWTLYQTWAVQNVKGLYDHIAPDPSHFPVMLKKAFAMQSSEPHYSLGELGRIQAPTLIVAGDSDAILPDHTNALAKAIPAARKIIVPGATHAGPVEKPDVYTAMAVDFFKTP